MEHPGLNRHILMGIFAFFVVGVSLLRIMSEEEFPRITAMKRVWGRSRGLAMHFLSNVGVPLVCGVVFLTRGIAGFGAPVSHQPDEKRSLRPSVLFVHAPKVNAPARTIFPLDLADPGPQRLLP